MVDSFFLIMARLNILVLRLSDKRDTAASSSHYVLADLIRGVLPEAQVDFAFLPPQRSPSIRGVISDADWTAFDLVLVSNAFVQEVVNLPWLLHAQAIPVWAPERAEHIPPILLGGSNAFVTQSLVRPDGTAVPDLLFFGEAERALPAFLVRWRAACGTKRQRLSIASDGLEGFWTTGSLPASPIPQAVARTGLSVPAGPATVLDNEAAGTIRVPVSSGCAAFCSFCFEGYERKPYREYALETILTQAKQLKRSYGAQTLEMDAFNLNTSTLLPLLVEHCTRLFDKVAFKSQRADGVAACPELIDLERAAGKHSFTLGIEGISARMRAFLCKSLCDADLASAIQTLLDRRVREIKLFYILTAHETAADLAEFGLFCTRLRTWMDAPQACTRVVISFGRLVRMPNTPLAYDRLFLDEGEWRFCVDGVAAACRRSKLESRFAFDWPDYLATQLLAACGHEHAGTVVRLACEGLSTHGAWRLSDAARLASALNLDAGPMVGRNRTFPFIRRVVSDAFLLQRWEAAQADLDAGYCLGQPCAGCTACITPMERDAITHHPRTLDISPSRIETVARIEADKRRLLPVDRHVTLPDAYAGHSAKWVTTHWMQTLLHHHPDLIENLLSIEALFFTHEKQGDPSLLPCGETILRLRAWHADALITALAACSDILPNAPVTQSVTPKIFRQATWRLRAQGAPREVAQTLSAWLNIQHLPHTLKRNDATGWLLALAPAALKKKTILELQVEPEETGVAVHLSFTAKADVHELFQLLKPIPNYPLARCTRLVL